MEVERYSHVLHLVSHVEGAAPAGARRARRAARRSSRPARCRARRRSGRCSSSPRPRASAAGCTAARSATSATTATSTPRSRSAARSSRTARPTSTRAPGSSRAPSPRRSSRRPSTRRPPCGARSSWRPASRDVPRGRPAGAARAERRGGARGRRGRGPAMILVIDNYDSFTFNLVQALQAAGADVRVVRNDAIDIGRRSRRWPTTRPRTCAGSSSRPGRATRTTPAISVATIAVAAERGIPLLGVCLGHAVDGGRVRRRRSSGRRRSSTARRPR